MSNYLEDPVKQLSIEECWDKLNQERFGRLALTAAGKTDIFPINYLAHDNKLLFRTAQGTKLTELTINKHVVFEIDGFSDTSAWSVIVKGDAKAITNFDDMYDADELGLKPWVPTLKQVYVEIIPAEVTGRSFVFGPEPERY